MTMRIAIVSPYVPHDHIEHAGGQFLLHWCRSLADSGAEVVVIAPQQVGAPPRRPSPKDGFSVCEVPLPVGESARRWGNKLTAPLLTPGWGVARAFRDHGPVASALRNADITEIQWSNFFPLRSYLSRFGAPIVAVAHDVINDAMRRRVARSEQPKDRLLSVLRWPTYRVNEIRHINLCDAVLTFSARDEGLMRKQGVKVPIRVIAPWLEPVESPRGPNPAPMVLMVGWFRRAENADGARWFLRNCWPRVKAAVPAARLVLAGSEPPADLRGEDVIVTGWVDDLGPCYESARVVIAPLFMGAGLKFKVAQAMQHGLPVVATPIAAEGYLEAGGGEAFVSITGDPEAFSAAVTKCLADVRFATDHGTRGAHWVGRSLDWDRSVRTTLELYRSLVDERPG